MRLSILTPILTRLPGAHARWEEGAGLAEVAAIAEAGDRLGYHHLSCSEHIAVPAEAAPTRGSTYWDPLAVFGYLAARTERIRFATHVLVLGYHHPLDIAKRYGTLDVVSNGRVVLGVGVGTLEEEFSLLGAPFADRGPRADDALRALRSSLSQPAPAYDGPYYRYAGMIVDPCAVQARVPLWVGGQTRRSLRRALALADGWAPFGLALPRLAAMLADCARPPAFEVVVAPGRALDPIADPEDTRARLGAMGEAGVTIVSSVVVHRSLPHYLEQLEALMTLASEPGVP